MPRHPQIIKNTLYLSVFNHAVSRRGPLKPVLHFPKIESLSHFVRGLYSVPHEGVKYINAHVPADAPKGCEGGEGYGFFVINNPFVLPRELRNIHVYKKHTNLQHTGHEHSISYDGFFPIYENKNILYENLWATATPEETVNGTLSVATATDNRLFCNYVRKLNGDFYSYGEPTIARKHLP